MRGVDIVFKAFGVLGVVGQREPQAASPRDRWWQRAQNWYVPRHRPRHGVCGRREGAMACWCAGGRRRRVPVCVCVCGREGWWACHLRGSRSAASGARRRPPPPPPPQTSPPRPAPCSPRRRQWRPPRRHLYTRHAPSAPPIEAKPISRVKGRHQASPSPTIEAKPIE